MPIHDPVSEHTSKSLDSDGEVQASLVVAQLERRRPEAFAHSRRVAELAVRVGRLARLPQDQIRQVYWGALVHDIGELDVPEPIFETVSPCGVVSSELLEPSQPSAKSTATAASIQDEKRIRPF